MRNGRLIEILVLRAMALQAQNKTDCALAVLGESLTLAEPQGFVRVFLDEGPAIAVLLKMGLGRGIWDTPRLAAYAERLLGTFDLQSLTGELAP